MGTKNRAEVIGYLGEDPELRFSANGTAVVNLRVATNYKPQDGPEETEWHRCVAFGKTAEACATHLHKGSQVCFEGRLQTRSWEKDGVTRYTTEIVASNFGVVFLGKKDD